MINTLAPKIRTLITPTDSQFTGFEKFAWIKEVLILLANYADSDFIGFEWFA